MDMDKELSIHILEKLDRMEGNISEIKLSQARTEVDIKHHIRRTDLLEDVVKLLKKQVDLLWWPFHAGAAVLRFLRLIR